MTTAQGTFDITRWDDQTYLDADGVKLGAIDVAKAFTGGLSGDSTARLLTAGGPVPTSAAYVAIERFVGSVDGLSGSFVLQHSAVMAGGAGDMSVRIVPDSGTGKLTGISGTLRIDKRDDGTHSYQLDYEV
ncbi:DUF3224 domain-containing protein [Kutzneria sp. CA-103260]|uniref:DUF3224 domain-containing protein n=1 Tax=Kutzneria sp. CA-103260 TaxID=2802641 RepID=UPI001BA71153|nr:DUF3224 domain-containing protein [Kutzneria sp. CA-103260]QUQ68027.1 hypothetical protein JJ691_57670 [Kutzneria sp. CA-103260]